MSRPTITAMAVLAFALILSACTPKQAFPNCDTPTLARAEGVMETATQAAEGTTEFAQALRRITVQCNYQSPAQAEHVAFDVVVDENGVIVEAQSTVTSDNPTSQMRQTAFAEAFPAAVVGKKLADLENVDRIGGSSLTTGAFNAALAGLKSQL